LNAAKPTVRRYFIEAQGLHTVIRLFVDPVVCAIVCFGLICIPDLDGTGSVSHILVLILFLDPNKGKTAFIIGSSLVADDNVVPSIPLWLEEGKSVSDDWVYPELQSLISVVETELDKRNVVFPDPSSLFGLV